MTNAPFDTVQDFRDIESINHFYEATGPLRHQPEEVLRNLRVMSRDNARTPVQWTSDEHAGFTSGTPWIGVNPNYVSINAQTDRASERSVFRFYQQLIELRHKNETVRLGDFAMLAEDHPTLYAFTRALAGSKLLIVGNVSGSTLTLPEDPSLDGLLATGLLILGNYGGKYDGEKHDADKHDGEPARELRPWEVRVLQVS